MQMHILPQNANTESVLDTNPLGEVKTMNNKNYSKSANNRESDAQNRVNNDTKNRTEQKNTQNEVKSDVMNHNTHSTENCGR